MKHKVPYGKEFIEFELDVPVEKLIAEKIEKAPDKRAIVRAAMENPIGSAKLCELAIGKRNAVIVINDITRPSPTQLLVEEISRELNEAGIRDSEITLLVATGNHRTNTEEELISMVGEEAYKRFMIINHNASDPDQLIDLGKTTRGLAVVVNRLVVESDLTILTGIITPHQSAGFSGGRKSIVPGVAGVKSLEQHHSLPIRSEHPVMGKLENNTFHEEAVEAARKVGVDFIVNVVKNSDGDITTVVAGDLVEAHEKGVADCKKAWEIQIQGKFDITIVSPGGYPKDFDMHQAQKALATAEMITKAGGSIILVAECAGGIGSFAQLLIESRDPQEVINCFKREGFNSINHSSKAYMYARVLQTHDVYFLTDKIDPLELKKMFFIPSASINAAYNNAKMKCEETPRVSFIPYAVDCIINIVS
ncbi:nickel-dependent lactate racemase [Paenibacillus sp. GP183]|uniref:nickel-dependent lactate racemase n=1 Tax=Paenibacillus sp. GP183 TaxID=1882751 RepID=UPI00089D7455|nr:nickel-dependent lactate racemase [Paenibacillus sp. GP183]SEC00673.1 Nickel-dependent lactate racemase [Paenibacillus sp. GP183]